MSDIDADAHHKDSNVRPAVGVGVMITRNGEVLLGRRRGAHGAGAFGWPGGGLAFGESLENAVHREAHEEAGLTVREFKLVCVSNVVEYGRHYVDFEFMVTAFDGTPEVREPEFIESWNWYPQGSPPEPLFQPCRLALESLRSGKFLNDSSPDR